MESKPKIVVAAVIEKDGKYLLIKEKLSDGIEKWIVPGGKVEFGEKLEDAVKREIKEETNLDIEILEFLDFYEAVFRAVARYEQDRTGQHRQRKQP